MLFDIGVLEHQCSHDEPNHDAPSQEVGHPHPVNGRRKSIGKPADGEAGADHASNVDWNRGWKGPRNRLVVVKREESVDKVSSDTRQTPQHAPQHAEVCRWEGPHAHRPADKKHGAVEAPRQSEPDQRAARSEALDSREHAMVSRHS